MNKYRKALKNYTTTRSERNLVSDIQSILLDFGADGIGYEYGDLGRIKSIHFKLLINDAHRLVHVPIEWEKTIQVLRNQKQYKDDYKSYRVALANVVDWLDAQMALLATNMVEFDQIFLPYVADPNTGKTFYQLAKDNNFMTISG